MKVLKRSNLKAFCRVETCDLALSLTLGLALVLTLSLTLSQSLRLEAGNE